MFCRIVHDSGIIKLYLNSVPCIWRLKMGDVYLILGASQLVSKLRDMIPG